MTKLIMFIATGFYSGYLPKAPGTWGTLVALPLNFFLLGLTPGNLAIVLGVIFMVAVSTAGSAEKIVDHKDPGIIVIDEIIGMFIALIGAPTTILAWATAFILFRIFDILKPFPVSWFDRRINGGLGIVMDDVMAGGYALVCMKLLGKTGLF